MRWVSEIHGVKISHYSLVAETGRLPSAKYGSGRCGRTGRAKVRSRHLVFEPKVTSQSGLTAETCANSQLVPPSIVDVRQLTACWHMLFQRLNPYLSNSRLQDCLSAIIIKLTWRLTPDRHSNADRHQLAGGIQGGAYSVGRLGRLVNLASLSSEPEDRSSGWRCSPEQAEPWLTQAPGFANSSRQNAIVSGINALSLLEEST